MIDANGRANLVSAMASLDVARKILETEVRLSPTPPEILAADLRVLRRRTNAVSSVKILYVPLNIVVIHSGALGESSRAVESRAMRCLRAAVNAAGEA